MGFHEKKKWYGHFAYLYVFISMPIARHFEQFYYVCNCEIIQYNLLLYVGTSTSYIIICGAKRKVRKVVLGGRPFHNFGRLY